MKLIVNDANVLIDMVELKILPHFFQLEIEFMTTSLVLNELFEEQQDALSRFIDNEVLQVEDMTPADLVHIKQLQRTKPGLSEQDCSAFFQAQKNGAVLLTSDNSLRKFAKENELEVHGHLWIFDKMVTEGVITPALAAKKLSALCSTINPKLGLPKKECEDRIKRWKR